jgi:cysteine desulfurase
LPTASLERPAPLDAIYLDHNATTPIDPRAARAMARCRRAAFGNPASQHGFAARARRALEEARKSVARIVGARGGPRGGRVVFTSGGTEANNLAILGLAAADKPRRIVISAVEHPSVAGPAEELARRGWQLDRIRVLPEGSIDLAHLSALLAEPPALVSIMLGNNETGVLQPVRQAAQMCRAAGTLIHCDAVQAVGKIAVDFSELGVDALTLSAHKFHGPRGVGALIVRHGVEPSPLLFGGFQQDGLRPGSEPVELAVGLAAALEAWERHARARLRRMSRLRDRLEALLLAECPGAVIVGVSAPRLPHTTSVAFPGLDRQALLMALDQAGVACSTGSACASGSSEPSPVLLAMGCPSEVVQGALRLSLGASTKAREVDEAARRIAGVFRAQKAQGERRKRGSPAPRPASKRL